MAKKIKVTRKQIKKDDEFLVLMKETILGVGAYWRFALAGVGVLLVIVLAYAGIRWYSHLSEGEAVAMLAEAESVFSAPISREGYRDAPGALESFDSEEERYAEALDHFEAVADRFPKTRQAAIAHYYSAISNQHLKNFDEAKRSYHDFLAVSDASNPFWSLAWQGIGYCEEAENNLDAALEAFKKLLGNENDLAMKTQSHLHLARIYERKKDYGEAVENLAAYLGDMGDGQDKRAIERRISILKRRMSAHAG